VTTPLARLLCRRIEREGPLTVAAFMAEALSHPEHGYYMQGDVFGRSGDFTTAPEISQMFGEMIGLWLADRWLGAGRPSRVRLVELGPGRGTLMADLLRAAGAVAGFRDAVSVHLVETSPALRRIQRQALARHGCVAWHGSFGEVPDGPLLLVANELFDALPVHQLVRMPAGWCERLVGLDAEGAFAFALAAELSPLAALLAPAVRAAPAGSVAEVCPAAISLAAAIGRRVGADGIAALVVDYGPAASAPGDSLQAVRRHRPQDALAEPGAADLTAHVDFAALARSAGEAGAVMYGPVPQGAFLDAIGLGVRAAALAARATPAQRRDIETARRRLIAPDQMGTLFKVLAMTPPGASVPAGFAALGMASGEGH